MKHFRLVIPLLLFALLFCACTKEPPAPEIIGGADVDPGTFPELYELFDAYFARFQATGIHEGDLRGQKCLYFDGTITEILAGTVRQEDGTLIRPKTGVAYSFPISLTCSLTQPMTLTRDSLEAFLEQSDDWIIYIVPVRRSWSPLDLTDCPELFPVINGILHIDATDEFLEEQNISGGSYKTISGFTNYLREGMSIETAIKRLRRYETEYGYQ